MYLVAGTGYLTLLSAGGVGNAKGRAASLVKW